MLGTYSGSGLGFGVAFTLKDGFSPVASRIRRRFSALSDHTDRLANKMQASFGKVAAGLGLVVAGIGALKGFLSNVTLSSSYQENINKLDVTFGKLAGKVRKFADSEALIDFGIDKVMATDMAALFGDMGTGMGIAQDQAAELAINLTKLAGDITSFKNLPIKQSRTALASIFTGETESLKRLGVLMTQKSLEEYQARINKGKTFIKYRDLDQPARVMVRYNFVVNATRNSVGDFLRTQENYANVQRAMEGTIVNLQIALGDKLKPTLTALYKVFTIGMRKLEAFSTTGIGKTIIAIISFTAVLVALGITVLGVSILLVQLGKLLAGMAFPLVIIGALIGFLVSAWSSFMDLVNEDAELSGGFLGFLQKTGALMYSILHIFDNANTAGFTITDTLYSFLEKLGLLEVVIELGTWIVRIKHFFKVTLYEFKKNFNALKKEVLTFLTTVSTYLNKFQTGIGKNTSKLQLWTKSALLWGKLLGGAMVGAIALITASLIKMAFAWAIVNFNTLLIVGIVGTLLYMMTHWDEVIKWVTASGENLAVTLGILYAAILQVTYVVMGLFGVTLSTAALIVLAVLAVALVFIYWDEIVQGLTETWENFMSIIDPFLDKWLKVWNYTPEWLQPLSDFFSGFDTVDINGQINKADSEAAFNNTSDIGHSMAKEKALAMVDQFNYMKVEPTPVKMSPLNFALYMDSDKVAEIVSKKQDEQDALL